MVYSSNQHDIDNLKAWQAMLANQTPGAPDWYDVINRVVEMLLARVLEREESRNRMTMD